MGKGLASFGLVGVFELERVLLRGVGAFLYRWLVDVKKNVIFVGNDT